MRKILSYLLLFILLGCKDVTRVNEPESNDSNKSPINEFDTTYTYIDKGIKINGYELYYLKVESYISMPAFGTYQIDEDENYYREFIFDADGNGYVIKGDDAYVYLDDAVRRGLITESQILEHNIGRKINKVTGNQVTEIDNTIINSRDNLSINVEIVEIIDNYYIYFTPYTDECNEDLIVEYQGYKFGLSNTCSSNSTTIREKLNSLNFFIVDKNTFELVDLIDAFENDIISVRDFYEYIYTPQLQDDQLYQIHYNKDNLTTIDKEEFIKQQQSSDSLLHWAFQLIGKYIKEDEHYIIFTYNFYEFYQIEVDKQYYNSIDISYLKDYYLSIKDGKIRIGKLNYSNYAEDDKTFDQDNFITTINSQHYFKVPNPDYCNEEIEFKFKGYEFGFSDSCTEFESEPGFYWLYSELNKMSIKWKTSNGKEIEMDLGNPGYIRLNDFYELIYTPVYKNDPLYKANYDKENVNQVDVNLIDDESSIYDNVYIVDKYDNYIVVTNNSLDFYQIETNKNYEISYTKKYDLYYENGISLLEK